MAPLILMVILVTGFAVAIPIEQIEIAESSIVPDILLEKTTIKPFVEILSTEKIEHKSSDNSELNSDIKVEKFENDAIIKEDNSSVITDKSFVEKIEKIPDEGSGDSIRKLDEISEVSTAATAESDDDEIYTIYKDENSNEFILENDSLPKIGARIFIEKQPPPPKIISHQKIVICSPQKKPKPPKDQVQKDEVDDDDDDDDNDEDEDEEDNYSNSKVNNKKKKKEKDKQKDEQKDEETEKEKLEKLEKVDMQIHGHTHGIHHKEESLKEYGHSHDVHHQINRYPGDNQNRPPYERPPDRPFDNRYPGDDQRRPPYDRPFDKPFDDRYQQPDPNRMPDRYDDERRRPQYPYDDRYSDDYNKRRPPSFYDEDDRRKPPILSTVTKRPVVVLRPTQKPVNKKQPVREIYEVEHIYELTDSEDDEIRLIQDESTEIVPSEQFTSEGIPDEETRILIKKKQPPKIKIPEITIICKKKPKRPSKKPKPPKPPKEKEEKPQKEKEEKESDKVQYEDEKEQSQVVLVYPSPPKQVTITNRRPNYIARPIFIYTYSSEKNDAEVGSYSKLEESHSSAIEDQPVIVAPENSEIVIKDSDDLTGKKIVLASPPILQVQVPTFSIQAGITNNQQLLQNIQSKLPSVSGSAQLILQPGVYNENRIPQFAYVQAQFGGANPKLPLNTASESDKLNVESKPDSMVTEKYITPTVQTESAKVSDSITVEAATTPSLPLSSSLPQFDDKSPFVSPVTIQEVPVRGVLPTIPQLAILADKHMQKKLDSGHSVVYLGASPILL